MARTREWVGTRTTYKLRAAERGKYEGGYLIDQYVATVDVTDETGDVGELGAWYGLQVGGGDLYDAVIEAARDDMRQELTKDEKQFLAHIAGAIVEENDQGFVTVEYYEKKKELDEAWDELSEQVSTELESRAEYEEED